MTYFEPEMSKDKPNLGTLGNYITFRKNQKMSRKFKICQKNCPSFLVLCITKA